MKKIIDPETAVLSTPIPIDIEPKPIPQSSRESASQPKNKVKVKHDVESADNEEDESEENDFNIRFIDVSANFDSTHKLKSINTESTISDNEIHFKSQLSKESSELEDADLPIDDRTFIQHLFQIIVTLHFRQESNIRYRMMTKSSRRNLVIAWVIYFSLWLIFLWQVNFAKH